MLRIGMWTGLLCAGLSGAAMAQGASYTDSDWNVSFVDNCGLPGPASITPITIDGDRKLRVALAEGDKGTCSSDDRTRHRAPFWERAELAQEGRMALGGKYRISTEVRFIEGFTGEREAFFQIHGWTGACKKAFPPVMLKFDDGKLRVELLRGVSAISSGKHRDVLKRDVDVRKLYDVPMQLVVDFDTSVRPSRVSLSLGGNVLVENEKVDYARCAEPRVKFGVYRPGGKGSKTSVVVFDDLRVERGE